MTFAKNICRSSLILALFTAGAVVLGPVFPAAALDSNNVGPAVVSVVPQSTAGDRAACINGTTTPPTVAFAKGPASVQRISTGTYIVRFNKNVTNCVRTATIGLCGNSGVEKPGEITTVRSVAFVDGVFVTTHASGGARSNRSFQLLVTCE